ncbi:hypothetical protein PSN45_001348 [Yamadazyma tenuis]|uniref:CID domain-containing protein n=1 Tax=Candida tenuis (strain ATCC 10573 / BCRC 21748 / CBS 615 / JCM 9827 / NBRC 10315 / NRRL Y-1498 / VKM Y-70) TaxID=590646 RepID=G3BCQ9_CANTC|nr:uncharacterized protein CANTEDRAFT_116914 [Yamadazyma tenuis ATCC 10573]XP_006690497.1 uncharacterized protein CANTEDRAFT_116914 [Yamadazyma tenuis ATCC 10573]EGV61282.1 hypothetical protein CANTEDRAFT_116914 [Yamadazyma tenuis ATCC 10573]EGV61283.1 hypothetical protein CANTEDRAFT_116914 [Yamadazyma tenuis ATCC 10573]WEJ93871.1 hypothetical protein PSN45_001348 [Yamadazyma tenuis]
MDSFEANTQFTQLLRELNPTVQSLRKAAHFAIKNWENEDYLFTSIMSILQDPKIEVNTKSTIFQFIDILVNESHTISSQPRSNYSYPYISSVKNSLPSILLDVLPASNNYNLHSVFNSLRNISRVLKIDCQKFEDDFSSFSPDILDDNDRQNIDLNVPYPNITLENSDSANDPVTRTWELLSQKRKQSYYERLRLLKHQKPVEQEVKESEMFNLRPKDKYGPNELSRKQILSRMEDDRETHKRSKENLWVVNRPKEVPYVTEHEFQQYYWNRYDSLSDKDEKALLETLDDFNTVVMASYKDNQF